MESFLHLLLELFLFSSFDEASWKRVLEFTLPVTFFEMQDGNMVQKVYIFKAEIGKVSCGLSPQVRLTHLLPLDKLNFYLLMLILS